MDKMYAKKISGNSFYVAAFGQLLIVLREKKIRGHRCALEQLHTNHVLFSQKRRKKGKN
jgi:hypothetical protein